MYLSFLHFSPIFFLLLEILLSSNIFNTIIMTFLFIYGQTPKMLNRRCYLKCRDHLCSFQIPGSALHRICPHSLGVVLCTPGSEDAHTLGCRLTIRSTLPSSHPLQRETKGTIIRMNQAAVRRLTPGLLFLELHFKAITTTTQNKITYSFIFSPWFLS